MERHCKQCARERSKAKHPKLSRQCRCCGLSFIGRPDQLYCSKACANSYLYENGVRAARHRATLKYCPECGLAFLARKDQRYCSKPCRNRQYFFLRRGLRRTSEGFNRQAIYERDHWVCQLCGELVDSQLPGNHPRGATLDHLVPVSVGGDHSPGNLQLAHRCCNSAKRDRVWGEGEQLRLAV